MLGEQDEAYINSSPQLTLMELEPAAVTHMGMYIGSSPTRSDSNVLMVIFTLYFNFTNVKKSPRKHFDVNNSCNALVCKFLSDWNTER